MYQGIQCKIVAEEMGRLWCIKSVHIVYCFFFEKARVCDVGKLCDKTQQKLIGQLLQDGNDRVGCNVGSWHLKILNI